MPVAKDLCICWKQGSRQTQVIEKEEVEANKVTSCKPNLNQVPSNDKDIKAFTDKEKLSTSFDPAERGEGTASPGP